MNRKTITILLAALAIVVVIALAWWWFLGRGVPTPNQGSTGSFGSAQNAGQASTTPNNPSAPSSYQVAATSGGYSVNGSGLYSYTGGVLPSGAYTLSGSAGGYSVLNGQGQVIGSLVPITGYSTPPLTSVPGVWLSGTGSVFNPIAINGIASANPQGGVAPHIGGSLGGGSQDFTGQLVGSLLGGAAAGAISCSGVLGTILGLGTAGGATTGGGTGGSTILGAVNPLAVHVSDDATHAALISIGTAVGANAGLHAGDEQQSFLSCLARTIAKVTLQQITVSVVNWINSGFNGSPAFVQNPTLFFANVANIAAGQFIQGSALSFLCSPFQLQIRIAIAQSYAQQQAYSCTLSSVINNINNFMNGGWSSGGWPGFISFTTMPTNNPYGAYLYAQVGLNSAISTAVNQQQQQLLQGQGFLSFQQQQNCQTSATPVTGPNKSSTAIPYSSETGQVLYSNCNLVTVTPGSVIAASINKTLGTSQDSLNLAKNFDEIISALISQLMSQALIGGLSNLSSGGNSYGDQFYTADQQQAMAQAQTLLTSMQGDVSNAQQYAQVEQGSISDIEQAQQNLNNLANCWQAIASSTLPAATLAAQNAASTLTTLQSWNTQINTYNNNITNANSAISLLEQLESSALSAGSTAAITTITSQYQNARASGQLPQPADITNAQQNRTTLQATLSTLNAQTAASLQQCTADE